MIFYFSGTGNSKWIAQEIAKATNDTAYDIISLCDVPDIKDHPFVGLIFPIYAWGAAEPMLNFARKLPATKAFTYGICTCGADAGLAMKKLSKIFNLDSSYSVMMPSNYIVGDNLESEEVICTKIENAKIVISTITSEILERTKSYKVHEGSLAFVKSNLATFGFNKFARTTKPFFVSNGCIGCGMCVKECPAKTIELQNNKPVWNETCYQCLRCINNCPAKAIQYGSKTLARGRYKLKNYM